MKYGYTAYASRHCHDILSPYFKNLSLPIAEDHLCELDHVQYSYRYTRSGITGSTHCHLIQKKYYKIDQLLNWLFLIFQIRKHIYEYKINRLRSMIEREVGFPVSLERSPTGSLVVPPDLAVKIPNIMQ